MHTDPNDLISFLFLIQMDANCGGGLEIGGTGNCIDWKVGDAILLDSAGLMHGTRNYTGDTDNRLVGIFIIHKNYLRINGIEIYGLYFGIPGVHLMCGSLVATTCM
jgi:hypothetical protein